MWWNRLHCLLIFKTLVIFVGLTVPIQFSRRYTIEYISINFKWHYWFINSTNHIFAELRRSAPRVNTASCVSQLTCTISTDRTPKQSGRMCLRLHLLLRYFKCQKLYVYMFVCVCQAKRESRDWTRRRPLFSLAHRTREGCSPSLKAIPYTEGGRSPFDSLQTSQNTIACHQETQCGRESGVDRYIDR